VRDRHKTVRHLEHKDGNFIERLTVMKVDEVTKNRNRGRPGLVVRGLCREDEQVWTEWVHSWLSEFQPN